MLVEGSRLGHVHAICFHTFNASGEHGRAGYHGIHELEDDDSGKIMVRIKTQVRWYHRVG